MAILEPQINGKYSEKRKKTTTYWKPKYKLSGAWFLHLAGQGSQIAPLTPLQQTH